MDAYDLRKVALWHQLGYAEWQDKIDKRMADVEAQQKRLNYDWECELAQDLGYSA